MLKCNFNLRLADDPGFAPHLASFNALCRSLDMILDSKYGVRSITAASVGELEDLLGRHLTQHVAIYGDGHARLKHHWLVDCLQQSLRDGLALDALVIERMHVALKAVAAHAKKTRAYERPVLTDVLTTALRDDRASVSLGLLGQAAVNPENRYEDPPPLP
jgi:hypothetical protein